MPGSQPMREINIRQEYLKLITDGVKTVEVRVGYPRMRSIQPGQELTFVSGDQGVPTTVRRVTEYPSFEEMLEREDALSIGGDLGESPREPACRDQEHLPAGERTAGRARDRDRTGALTNATLPSVCTDIRAPSRRLFRCPKPRPASLS